MISAVHDSGFAVARSMQASFVTVAILLPNVCYCLVSANKMYMRLLAHIAADIKKLVISAIQNYKS